MLASAFLLLDYYQNIKFFISFFFTIYYITLRENVQHEERCCWTASDDQGQGRCHRNIQRNNLLFEQTDEIYQLAVAAPQYIFSPLSFLTVFFVDGWMEEWRDGKREVRGSQCYRLTGRPAGRKWPGLHICTPLSNKQHKETVGTLYIVCLPSSCPPVLFFKYTYRAAAAAAAEKGEREREGK